MINPQAFQCGMNYGKVMSFRRYMRMLVRFTDGRIPLIPTTNAQAFISGAYRGYILANPGCSIR
jgi:hypothetical protein